MRSLLLIAPFLLAAPAAARIDTSPAAARATVQRYYAAIDRGDFRTAYRLWGDNGRRSGQTFDGFARGFARTADTRVVTGPPRDGDAGMSQVWLTVPVDVYARLKDGRRQHFRGTYVMRRVNGDVGATPAQQAWPIDQARLRRVG